MSLFLPSATFLINIAKFLNLKFKCGAITLANMISTKYASNDLVESNTLCSWWWWWWWRSCAPATNSARWWCRDIWVTSFWLGFACSRSSTHGVMESLQFKMVKGNHYWSCLLQLKQDANKQIIHCGHHHLNHNPCHLHHHHHLIIPIRREPESKLRASLSLEEGGLPRSNEVGSRCCGQW